MNPLDFLDTASRLIALENATEADIRSAVSRAYYAVYHYILSWWNSNDQFPDYKDRGHAKIRMALFNARIPTARNFSRDLKELNGRRQDADYALTLRFHPEEGQRLLDLAREAIAAFDALDKVTLKEGIQDYLRKTNQIR